MKTRRTRRTMAMCSIAAILSTLALASCAKNATVDQSGGTLSSSPQTNSSVQSGVNSAQSVDSDTVSDGDNVSTGGDSEAGNNGIIAYTLDEGIFTRWDAFGDEIDNMCKETFTVSDWEFTFTNWGSSFMGDTEEDGTVEGIFLISYSAEYKGDGSSIGTIKASDAVITSPSGESLNSLLAEYMTLMSDDWESVPDFSSDNLEYNTATGFFWVPYSSDGTYTVKFGVDDCTAELGMPITAANYLNDEADDRDEQEPTAEEE